MPDSLLNTNVMNFDYEERISESCKNIPKSFIREILDLAQLPDMISFAGGLPNPEFFPVAQINKAFNKIMEKDGGSVLQYSGSQGYLPLREWICERYNKKYGLQMAPQNIIITNGSQQALDMMGKMFINPEDPLILEKPSYLGAIQAFSAYLPHFHQVSLTDSGVDVFELEQVIKKTNSKVFYGIPNFQNPSGISYSSDTRKRVAELLQYLGVMFVEDDPYNEIRFEGEFCPPIYSYIPDQTIWCGSFSKIIAPGIRTGWICAPEPLIPHLLRIKQATDLHTNNIVQRVIHQFFLDNDIESHLTKIRKAYKSQKNTMMNAIHEYFPKDVIMTNPEGGMFLWLTLPKYLNSEEIISEALNKKVSFVPGQSFFTSTEGQQNIRLNFSNSSEKQIIEGVRRLAETMQEFSRTKKRMISA